MAEKAEAVTPPNQNEILDSSTATASNHAILDSSDPYEKLNALSGGRTNCDVNELSLKTESGCTEDCRNGDVGLLEIAVEAQPDLVFESDLVCVNQEQLSFVRPRVYLERESFSNQNEDSMSRTANVRLSEYISLLKIC